MNDIITQVVIKAHSERSTQFPQTAFICLGRNSLVDAARSNTIALPYSRSIWVFPWESPQKILHIIKCHSGWSKTHLTVSTEQVLLQTSESCMCKLISHFTMGLYSSFQPPCLIWYMYIWDKEDHRCRHGVYGICTPWRLLLTSHTVWYKCTCKCHSKSH